MFEVRTAPGDHCNYCEQAKPTKWKLVFDGPLYISFSICDDCVLKQANNFRVMAGEVQRQRWWEKDMHPLLKMRATGRFDGI